MTADLTLLTPLIVVGAAAVAILVFIAFQRDHRQTVVLTVGALGLALIMLCAIAGASSRQVTALMVMDDFALFYIGLIFAASLVVAVLSYCYLDGQTARPEEYYVLLLCATLGAAVMAASNHFASFFLGLEILSVSLYAMMAYPRTGRLNIEAAVKYLILAAGSAAFLLFGMALVYGAMGTMQFSMIAAGRNALGHADTAVLIAGCALMIVGIGFKLAVAPFHWWTPDVYQGAPAPVTAFVATVSKGAMFAVLLRFFSQVDMHEYRSIYVVFVIMAIASMFVGNFLALLQDNVKRILAYSSITHLGYLLVAFLASGPWAGAAAAFYLVAYFITTLGAFGVITVLSGREREADEVEDYRGLFWTRPWLAGVFTAMLLSLAGIPLTAGFIGKFYVLAAGEQSARWLAVLMLVANSAIGLFYYLRIIVAMCAPRAADSAGGGASVSGPSVKWPGIAMLGGLTVALVWVGVYPAPLIHLVRAVVAAGPVLP